MSSQLEIVEIAPGIIFAADYRTGVIHGQHMEFSELQSIAIEVMIESFREYGFLSWRNEQIMPHVRDDHHGRTIRDLFRDKRNGKTVAHPAWGTLLRPGRRRGYVELAIDRGKFLEGSA